MCALRKALAVRCGLAIRGNNPDYATGLPENMAMGVVEMMEMMELTIIIVKKMRVKRERKNDYLPQKRGGKSNNGNGRSSSNEKTPKGLVR